MASGEEDTGGEVVERQGEEDREADGEVSEVRGGEHEYWDRGEGGRGGMGGGSGQGVLG